MRSFEYRLYPNRAQRAALMACLIASRGLYNEMLERQKAHHAETGRFLTEYDLSAVFRGRGGGTVPATVVQTLADRLDKALRRFLASRALGRPGGFPRFKGPHRWHSIHLRQYGRGMDAFLDILRDKAASAGHAVVRVPAQYTSQRCSRCGEVVPKALSVRTHVCPRCGYVADRDVNAARNILARGLELDTAGAQPSPQNRGAGPGATRSRRP